MLSALSLNLAFWLVAGAPATTRRRLAVVQVPAGLPRLVRLAGTDGATFVWLDDVIRAEAAALFPGQDGARVGGLPPRARLRSSSSTTRAASRSWRRSSSRCGSGAGATSSGWRSRAAASDDAVAAPRAAARGRADDVYRVAGPLDVRALGQLMDLPGFARACAIPAAAADDAAGVRRRTRISSRCSSAKTSCCTTRTSRSSRWWRSSRAAADDPDVLAIKQTLYRTSGDSPIVAALTRAADAGKQVTVLVELMARFDETRNIRWARRLEEMGAHVIYGIRQYKVHAKICLVVRRTPAGLRRYVHLGTGNYNDGTARLYTDFGLLTADPQIARRRLGVLERPDRLLRSAAAQASWSWRRRLLRSRLLALIEREQRRAEAGQPARIRAKMNSLVDVDIVRALYRASQAGVRIELNVRGICILRPGVKGLSENITVTSDRRTVTWSTRASSSSTTAATRRCTCRAPTGCRATSIGASS